MPVKIRLMRIGAKKRPFYRVVAIDEQKKRNGQYLELLGTYNPLTNPKEIILKQELIDKWVKNGAVLSHGFLRITGQAPQKPPRQAKKAPKAETPAAPKPTEETPATDPESVEDGTDTKVEENEPIVEAETAATEEAKAEEPIEESAEPAPTE